MVCQAFFLLYYCVLVTLSTSSIAKPNVSPTCEIVPRTVTTLPGWSCLTWSRMALLWTVQSSTAPRVGFCTVTVKLLP